MIKHSLYISLIGALLALLGCSSSQDVFGTTVTTTIADNLTGLSQPPEQEVIEKTPENTLFARLSGSNRSSELRLVARNGDYETWKAVDGSALVLVSGVVVSTFGLGHDLYTADATDLLMLLRARKNGDSERIHRYLDGENQVFLRAYRCTVIVEGEKPNSLTQISESCRGVNTNFANIYAIDRSRNLVWSSRQWLGPEVGYVEIALSNTRAAAQDRVIEAVPVPLYDLTKYGG